MDKSLMPNCVDCGKPYEDFGLDMVLPDDQWLMVYPEKDGLLCASCIVKRAAKITDAISVRAVIYLGRDFGKRPCQSTSA